MTLSSIAFPRKLFSPGLVRDTETRETLPSISSQGLLPSLRSTVVALGDPGSPQSPWNSVSYLQNGRLEQSGPGTFLTRDWKLCVKTKDTDKPTDGILCHETGALGNQVSPTTSGTFTEHLQESRGMQAPSCVPASPPRHLGTNHCH